MYVCMYVCEEMKAVQRAKIAEKQLVLSQLAKMNEDLAASVKQVSSHTYIHTFIYTYIHVHKHVCIFYNCYRELKNRIINHL